MESWSAQSERFTVNFFLDTNILCYLIDDTYPALTNFIKALAEMPTVSLFSSEYVLAELMEVRKKEDYYQEVMTRAKRDGRYINISSFIKHNKRYDIPHYSYEGDLIAPVITHVDKDIETIVNDFKITFDSRFHDRLLSPMKGICLSTKISREDSLVLVSSLFRGDREVIPNRVVLLTNDDDFEKWSEKAKLEIGNVLQEHGLTPPYVEHIGRLGKVCEGSDSQWNLTLNDTDGTQVAKDYVMSCIKWMFAEYFIGTVTPADDAPNAPAHTLFLKMMAPEVHNNLYTIVVDKDLGFIYCPQNKADFYYNYRSIGDSIELDGRQITLGYVCDIREEDPEDVFVKLNQKGNMVFIHPDSF